MTGSLSWSKTTDSRNIEKRKQFRLMKTNIQRFLSHTKVDMVNKLTIQELKQVSILMHHLNQKLDADETNF